MSKFQSRWGWHPCDYDTFRKLKAIHKWYWQYLRDFATWQRWIRKLPKNRRGPEPQYCPVFKHDPSWVEEYQNARHPKPESEVSPMKYSVDHINQTYLRCRDWQESKKAA